MYFDFLFEKIAGALFKIENLGRGEPNGRNDPHQRDSTIPPNCNAMEE